MVILEAIAPQLFQVCIAKCIIFITTSHEYKTGNTCRLKITLIGIHSGHVT